MSEFNRRDFNTALIAGLTLVASGSLMAASARNRPIARTRLGQVRGFRRNEAEIYLGIPYGASTAGERRFLPPAPVAAWSGVRDAITLGPRAPQRGERFYMNPTYGEYFAGGRAQELIAMNEPMSEDCLVLNVLTPRADRRGRPVMVYLHGGGLATGSGAVHTLGDRFVVEQDVVLVTVNHRLNNFGFLFFGDLSPKYTEGNPGLLDLVAALRWVKDNIANFGGNPSKVTIFGESGGGSKVALLMAMPQAKGLFRAGIIESTGMPNPVARDVATRQAQDTLRTLGIGANDLNQIHTLPMENFIPGAPGSGGISGANVCVDEKTLSEAPWSKGAPATAVDIPLIVGACKDEASLFIGMPDRTLFTLPDWTVVATRLAFMIQKPQEVVEPAVAAYRGVYAQDTPSQIFFRMASLATIGRAARPTAEAKALQPAPVYLYRMEYDTQLPPGLGALHTCELPLANRLVMQPRAESLSKQLAGAWAGFARTGGDPNHSGMPRWERYKQGPGASMMVFDLVSRSGPDPEEGAQRIWLDVLGSTPVPINARTTPRPA